MEKLSWRERNPEKDKEIKHSSYLQNKQKFIEKSKEWKQNNKEKLKLSAKKYRSKNKEILVEKNRDYRSKNSEKVMENRRRYRMENLDRILKKNKEYRQKNRLKTNEYMQNRRKNDVNFKLTQALRHRIYLAIKNNSKSGSSVKDLGCSIQFFKGYIEAQFKKGMSWDNWTKKGWHLDHKKPLSKFDLSNREDFLKATHYTNMQPMWWIDNIRKSDKFYE